MIKKWMYDEEKKLIDNYATKTNSELMELFPDRTKESVENKIKALKKQNKLPRYKNQEVIHKSYQSRQNPKNLFETKE